MRSLVLLFLLFTLTNAHPSKQCELSSDRCTLLDFQQHDDARKCGPGSPSSDPSLKDCNALELCVGPSDDEKGKYYCNLVFGANDDRTQAEGTPDGAIEAACKAWKNNQYCQSDTAAVTGIVAGVIGGVALIAFVAYYAISKKHKKIGSVKTSGGGGAKNYQVYKPMV